MLMNVLKIFLISILFFIFSCVIAKKQEPPFYKDSDISQVLHSFDNIKEVDTKFKANFERDDIDYKGDGRLVISKNGDLQLRIYLLGMLVFEMESNNGEINSKPPLDNNKKVFLANGLKECIFWWNIKDYSISEENGQYLLENDVKRLWIDKNTMMPLRQTMSLEDDLYLDITYDEPKKINDIWYPQKILVQLSNYKLTLIINDILFSRGS